MAGGTNIKPCPHQAMSALAALLPPIPFTASHALHKNNSDRSSAKYQRHFDCILYSTHFFVSLPEPSIEVKEL